MGALRADQLNKGVQRVHRVPRREINFRPDFVQLSRTELTPGELKGKRFGHFCNAVNGIL